jgi:hypothetical protein
MNMHLQAIEPMSHTELKALVIAIAGALEDDEHGAEHLELVVRLLCNAGVLS